jgi:hypothetical protein
MTESNIGYFSMLEGIVSLVSKLNEQNIDVKDFFLDISVGLCFSRYWKDHNLEDKYGERKRYDHNYPDYMRQSLSNSQTPWCYPIAAKDEFDQWLINDYVNKGKLRSFLIKKGIKINLKEVRL